MTMSDTPEEPGITGSAPLYTSQVEPLNPERHAKLGIRRLDAPFAFAAKTHFVPLLATEFPAAATSYPIIFAGDEMAPVAVMGVRADENLFISKEGVPRPDTYLPSYIRRYPFVVANRPDGETGVVCLDLGSDLIAEDAEMPLFQDGQLTPFGQECIDLCQRFEEDRIRSEQIFNQIKALELLVLRAAHHQPRDREGRPVGDPVVIAEFYAVDEGLLNGLSGDQLVGLRDTGALAFIYAHLISLWHWERLVNLQVVSDAQQSAANAA